MDLAERVTRLEENPKEVKKLKAYQQTQDKTLKNLSDSLNLLRRDNENIKRITLRSTISLAIASDNQDMVMTFINAWKGIANPAMIHEIEQEDNARFFEGIDRARQDHQGVYNEKDTRVVWALTLKCFFSGQLSLVETVLCDFRLHCRSIMNCLIQFDVVSYS